MRQDQIELTKKKAQKEVRNIYPQEFYGTDNKKILEQLEEGINANVGNNFTIENTEGDELMTNRRQAFKLVQSQDKIKKEKVILKNTVFLSPRAFRLCRMYGCEANYQFAIKCLFQDYPMSLITIVFFLSITVFAFSLRICERPVMLLLGESHGMDFEQLENSIWCVIITMTTVGYGDFYPRTVFGRLLDIIIAIWGIFIVSMMVVVLSNTLEMDNSEKRALKVLQRLEVRKQLRMKAAYLLTGIATYNFLERKKRKAGKLKLSQEYLTQKSIKIKKYTDEFRMVNRKIKNLYDKDNLYEEISRQFDFIKEDVKNLNDTQDKLCTYLEENFNLGLQKNYLD